MAPDRRARREKEQHHKGHRQSVDPIQQAVMEKLQQRMQGAIDATTPEALLKAWLPIVPDQMQQAFAKLFGAFGGQSRATVADTATGEAPPSSTCSRP